MQTFNSVIPSEAKDFAFSHTRKTRFLGFARNDSRVTSQPERKKDGRLKLLERLSRLERIEPDGLFRLCQLRIDDRRNN
jgi:hypothetical protein